MARAYRRVDLLLAALGLTRAQAGVGPDGPGDFPVRVPRGFVRRMRHGDPADPLLRQVLPLAAEFAEVPGFVADPVGDAHSTRTAGLLQKYRGRALLITTAACAVHCRYCFRRAFAYEDHAMSGPRLDAAIGQLAADPSVEELVLSGGDPLSLGDARLERILSAVDRLPHLRRIRLHTRLPVVLPERIDDGLARVLGRLSKPLVTVVHANHANEIDAEVSAALVRLGGFSAQLLNQSVLLRGVNDSADALAALSSRLFAAGVLPYYLHQLDRVHGAAHFAIDDQAAVCLVRELAACLPGYLVPRLVREIEGAPSKLPIGP